jgi:hypothetical protein
MTLATPLIRDPRNALEPTLHAPAQEVKSVMAVLLAVVAALGALAWAIVSALYALSRSALGRTIPRPSRERADTSPRVALNAGGVGGGGTR